MKNEVTFHDIPPTVFVGSVIMPENHTHNMKVTCPNCNGEGRVLVNKYTKMCEWCNGSGVIRVVERILPERSDGRVR